MVDTPAQTTLSPTKVMTHVFLPFAFGHYTSFIFRNINAVLTPFLVSALSLSAGQLGILSSAYFFSFSLAQLPVGLALDRYGPKRVQLFLLGIAVIGAVLFGIGQNFSTLLIARILIGLGLASCFMGSIKILSFWVPDKKLPSIHGFLLAAGGLGAMTSTLPVAWLVGFISWRILFFALAGITLMVMLAIAIWVPKDPIERRTVKWQSLTSLREVYRNRAFRRVISLLLLPHTVAFGLQGLWMGKWLQDIGRYDNETTSIYLFIGMGAIALGSLSVGFIVRGLHHRMGGQFRYQAHGSRWFGRNFIPAGADFMPLQYRSLTAGTVDRIYPDWYHRWPGIYHRSTECVACNDWPCSNLSKPADFIRCLSDANRLWRHHWFLVC
ncbi:MFS transporter [Serratia sp. 2723]|uniref:MFS transporter n=1 Tax=unclassified Serratia (in: enterobacteria) TaxID=2647522 RepID=UPI003D2594D8